MSAIRFVAREKGQFSAELRSRVQRYFKENNLSTKGNRSVIVKAIVLGAMFLLPLPIEILVPMPVWAWVSMAIVQGIGGAGVGMCLMHDSLHGSFSKKGWVNDMLGFSMYILGGNAFTWKVQHNLFTIPTPTSSGTTKTFVSAACCGFQLRPRLGSCTATSTSTPCSCIRSAACP